MSTTLIDKLFEVMQRVTEAKLLSWDGPDDTSGSIRLDTKFTVKKDGGGPVVCLNGQPHYTDASKSLARAAQLAFNEALESRKEADIAAERAEFEKRVAAIRKGRQ